MKNIFQLPEFFAFFKYDWKKSFNKGFTLIELLIVIVLIGILSGVVITVIDPIRVQNITQDGVTVSSISKIVLSTESYRSAYSSPPRPNDFIKGLLNATSKSSADCENNSDSCTFSIESSPLPTTCSTSYYGNGDSQCYFFYEISESDTGSGFYLYAKAHGTDNLYVYKSFQDDSKLMLCPNSYPIDEASCEEI